MQVAPISTKPLSRVHLYVGRSHANFQSSGFKNGRDEPMPPPAALSLYEEKLKGGQGWSAGSNGQVDPPYHLGPLVEWYLLGFRGFGGVSDQFQAILVKPGLSGEPLT